MGLKHKEIAIMQIVSTNFVAIGSIIVALALAVLIFPIIGKENTVLAVDIF
ncbi:hypothetical protein [Nitrosopumilus sp.]|uniref:hypothetical protein n=1 Tax=Nitrosopumilus sp. TaxID=2024843 RepID=UPI002931F021|nr:hypothetical protein [Nitrosopumilus sp.]